MPKLAEIFGVELKDLLDNNSNKIKIVQTNNDNKDNSVNNSIVLILPDKESVEKLVDALKGKI